MKKPETEVRNFTVDNVKFWDGSGNVTFTLRLGDWLTIYGCRIVEGSKGDFVAFPSRKGKDDKYYNHVWMRLSEQEQSNIVKMVEDELNK